MERFKNYASEIIELFLLGIIFIIALPFRVLYLLTNKPASR